MREFLEVYLATIHKVSKATLLSNVIILIAIGIILGSLGIMRFDQIAVIHAIGYWISVCFTGYIIYIPTFYWGRKAFLFFKIGPFGSLCGLSLIATLLMCFAIVLISSIFFGWDNMNLRDFLELFLITLLIGSIVHSIVIIKNYIQFQNSQLNKENTSASTLVSADQIIQQLPSNLRGDLLCLESEDHYLKVYTDKGQHLLLMRLRDAVNLLQDYPGLQTHRSWWVSESAILESKREGSKILLLLKNNVKVPISRTYLSAVKERKLL